VLAIFRVYIDRHGPGEELSDILGKYKPLTSRGRSPEVAAARP
jgi:hypothetical protein